LLACLQLQATVLNSIAITEYPAAFINPLVALNNSIKQSQSCAGLRSDIPESCTISEKGEGSPYFHVVFRGIL
jgi:hypothetical protein